MLPQVTSKNATFAILARFLQVRGQNYLIFQGGSESAIRISRAPQLDAETALGNDKFEPLVLLTLTRFSKKTSHLASSLIVVFAYKV